MPLEYEPPKKAKNRSSESLDRRALERVEKLFTEIKSIDAQPLSDAGNFAPMPAIENHAQPIDVEKLQARIRELEKQLTESEQRAALATQAAAAMSEAEKSPEANILYEKEKVGYAFREEQLLPLQLLTAPEESSKNLIKAPLTVSGEAIGEMKIAPPPEREWTSEEESLTSAVAQQVSLQIQNLRLLAEAERARAEAQAATRQFTHQSWEEFLDAVHERERIGFTYDQNEVNYFNESTPTDVDFQAAVSVLDQQVGQLYLQAAPDKPLTEEDKALANAVARQVAQQVENLRLLADASRARAEAEEATRRLARDSWKSYVARQGEFIGFIYNTDQVLPLEEEPANITVTHPLVVRGEPIGKLAIAGEQVLTEDQIQILTAIANQTSVHLEALRLNEELQQRAQQLQELDRLKSSFLANMSHELRTPLNSILGFSDVMLEGIDGPLTDYMQNDIRLIQKNGQHLLHLINDVLDMAKIESGRMNLHPEKFNVHELFDEVSSITSTLANAKNLVLFVEPDSDKTVEIFADNTRIRQVMINLVNNSIKFTETGNISMRVDKRGDNDILITVKDTGIGIPDDHLEKIFQEFSQVDTSTTRKAGGTGLGLPISRRLVEMHGGRLWAESTGIAGEGSTFYIELPRDAKITEPIENTTK